MTYAPYARIILRYGAGLLLGSSVGDMLASDVDAVNTLSTVISLGVAAATEIAYYLAKRWGWTT